MSRHQEAVIIETHFVVVTQNTEYRLRPNPDLPEGYAGGCVLEWRGLDEENWSDYFAIEPGGGQSPGRGADQSGRQCGRRGRKGDSSGEDLLREWMHVQAGG